MASSDRAPTSQKRSMRLDDLDMRAFLRRALDLCPIEDPHRLNILSELSNECLTRFERIGDFESLAEAVALRRQALDLRPSGTGKRHNSLTNLANALHTRYEQLGDSDALAEALVLHRQALDLCPPGHPDRSMPLNNLAHTLQTRYEQLGDSDTLAEALGLHRQALDLRPPGHPDRSMSLENLAIALHTRYEQLGDSDALAEALVLHRQALDLRPPGHPYRPNSLNNLAGALRTRYAERGDSNALAEALDLHRQALDLHPPGHPNRSASLNDLASALHARYEQLGDSDVLAEALDLHRQALDLRRAGHPDRSTSLSNLAYALQTRYEQLGDSDTLAEALDLHRQALDLRPLGHPDRSTSLINLAHALQTRYEQLGDSDTLVEALNLNRQALDLRPPGHPNRHASLSNLAEALHTRYMLLGDSNALAEALDLHRQALHLVPPGHPSRYLFLTNLAGTLRPRYEQLGDSNALAEALNLNRQALDLCPPGHPNRFITLTNLAVALSPQSEQLGDSASLDQAIDLYRQALELRPYPHPDRPLSLLNLGFALQTRFAKQTLACDFDEAFEIAREGLRSCNDGHPMRVRFLFRIAEYLLVRFLFGIAEYHIIGFKGGIRHILEGLQDRTSPANERRLQDRTSPANERLSFAVRLLPTVEAVIQLSSNNRVAATVPQIDLDEMVLRVYILVLQLLPQAASFGLDHKARLHVLSSAETISRDAAARAVSAGRTADAVEMLEEGRSVFWSQALRLRGTELDLLPDQDAQKLRNIFQTLEPGDIHEGSMSVAQRERHVDERRRLSKVAESLIDDIRSRPGWSRFLLPPAFSALLQSLPEKGFAVMLVASSLGHHALVLSRAETQVKHVLLATPPGGSFSQTFRAGLPRDGGQELSVTDETLVDRALGVSRRRHKKPRDRFDMMLEQLWMLIVKPVVDLLNLKKVSGRARPRIWWCATGDFSFLPIHAATGISQNGVTESASDYFVSSYVPTLSALTKSRDGWRSIQRSRLTGLLAACKTSPGQRTLDNVVPEVEATRKCFESVSARVLLSSSPNTSAQVLRDAFTAQSPHILHLACHGEQAKRPLESAFLLSDGRLSIQDLMRIHLPDAVLAFLSACQTASASEDQPDQAVHLAASMLFYGFRSVVGTMWSMNDEDGPDVARWFYEALFVKDEMDLDDIAYALDGAVTKLREKGAPTSQWALFIHIGG